MRRIATALVLASLLARLGSAFPAPEILLDLYDNPSVSTSPLNLHRLDPTGARIAWIERGRALSVLELDAETVVSIRFPDLLGPATEFRWSPDGQAVTMTENVFLYFYEPDVWIVDVQTSSVKACTDDGLFGDVFRLRERARLDLHPSWRAEAELTFLRPIGPDPYGEIEMRGVDRVACATIDASSTDDISTSLFPLPAGFPDAFSVLLPPVWSPLGNLVALITRSALPDAERDGVWLLDGQTGALRTFIPTSTFAAGFPDWYDAGELVPRDVAWIGDGSSVLVFVEDLDPSATWPRMNLFVIDAASGSAQPVASYDGYADRADFLAPGEGGRTGAFEVPQQAVTLPGRLGFLTLHQEIDPSDHPGEVELRWHAVDGGRAIRMDATALPTNARGRGLAPGVVSATETGRVLILNRYLLQLDLASFGPTTP